MTSTTPPLDPALLAQLTPEQRQALARVLAPALKAAKEERDRLNIVDWAETRFWVPDLRDPKNPDLPQRPGLIIIPNHIKTILRFMFDPNRGVTEYYQTLIWSTIKKSAKTLIAAIVARWVAETWGPYADVICVANDMEQARGRIYEAAMKSIRLHPDFNKQRDELVDAQGNIIWSIDQKGAHYEVDGSGLRAIPHDYRGEAGSNSPCSVYTEMWGMSDERARRLWDELTPPPTRHAIRFAEGYAGFTGDANLWQELWDQAQDVKSGGSRQLTRSDLEPYGGWVDDQGIPFDDEPPIWVNEAARICAYIDQGVPARRLPWQRGIEGEAYYRAREASERPEAFRRLHLNEWVSSVSEFIPIALWDACQIHRVGQVPAAGVKGGHPVDANGRFFVPHLDPHTPLVIGVDASVTGDCTAMVTVSRAPWAPETEVIIRDCQVWVPPPGKGGLDYHTTINRALRKMCRDYDVVCIAFDPYQMHSSMQDIMRGRTVRDYDDEGSDADSDDMVPTWCYPFSQAGMRNQADKNFYDMIMQKRVWHLGFPDLTTHIRNAAAKTAKDEDTKLRLVKRAPTLRIDAAVAASMATWQCLHLNLPV